MFQIQENLSLMEVPVKKVMTNIGRGFLLKLYTADTTRIKHVSTYVCTGQIFDVVRTRTRLWAVK